MSLPPRDRSGGRGYGRPDSGRPDLRAPDAKSAPRRQGAPELSAEARPEPAVAGGKKRAGKDIPTLPGAGAAKGLPKGRQEPTLRRPAPSAPPTRFGLFAGARSIVSGTAAGKPAPVRVSGDRKTPPPLKPVSLGPPIEPTLSFAARAGKSGAGGDRKAGGGGNGGRGKVRSARGGGAGRGGGRGSGKKRRGWARRLFSWLVVLGVWGLVAAAALVAYYAYDLPPLSGLNLVERQPSVTLIGDDGSTLATFGDLYGRFVPVKDMAPVLPEAVIATEDQRFYHHFGIDPIGMLRAAVVDLFAGHFVEGGSTITQQLAKNVFLSPARTVRRKVQEILLALELERHLSKNQILGLYLNRVYLGAGTYGVDAAAHRYFNTAPHDLTLSEAAMLAGLLKAPSHFAPTNDLAAARARASVVLDRMVDVGYITPAQAAAAKAHPATPAAQAPPLKNARYYTDWVLRHVDDYIGHHWQDVIITTTIDPRLQSDAEAAVGAVMDAEGAKRHAGQAAMIVLGLDGAVRAMVGGRNYATSPFNRATQARRQPGSSFKLFDYLAGLEGGLTPESQFFDGPISVGNWHPQDFERRYIGQVSLAEAFALSLNTVAVEVTQKVGMNKVIALAHRLGITDPLPDVPSLALGSCDLSLIELTGAYDAVANGGHGVIPYGIAEIRTPNGKVLYRRQGGGLGQVLAPGIVRQMTELLEGVVQHGTGRAARLDRPAGGKTGTSQDFRDAWFMGFTAELTAGVWVGNDNDSPMKHVVGGSLPAHIWHHFMTAALAGVPARPLLQNLPAGGGPTAAPQTAPAPKSLWDKIVQEFNGTRTSAPRPAHHEGRAAPFSEPQGVMPHPPVESATTPAPGRGPFSPGQ